jgi:hypothetical protein
MSTSITVANFWLRNALISGSMGHHDSEIANGGCIDRDDAGVVDVEIA